MENQKTWVTHPKYNCDTVEEEVKGLDDHRSCVIMKWFDETDQYERMYQGEIKNIPLEYLDLKVHSVHYSKIVRIYLEKD